MYFFDHVIHRDKRVEHVVYLIIFHIKHKYRIMITTTDMRNVGIPVM